MSSPSDPLGRGIGTASRPVIYRDGKRQFTPPNQHTFKRNPGAYSASLNIDLEWRHWSMGLGIGAAGMDIADLNGDGTKEVVASASPASEFSFGPNNYWYVLEQDADGSYSQHWTSDLYANAIRCLVLAPFNADQRPDICIAEGGVIHVYDGVTKAEIRTVVTSASEIRGLNVVDVDSDFQLEFVFVDSSALYIYSATGALEQKLTGYGGTDVKVGNVTQDRTLEIVIGNDTATGHVLDGRFRQPILAYPQGLGYRIALVDFTGDGTEEIIGANSWYRISAFEVGWSRTAVWQITTSHDIAAIKTTDVEGDGIPELIYGDAQWGAIHVCNAKNGVQKWTLPNSEHSVTNIAVGNTDADSANEIFFGAGYTSTGPDYLFCFDSATKALEWQSQDITGPFGAGAFGDVDADGTLEFLYGSFASESGYDDGLWFVHNAQTKALEFASDPATGISWMGLWKIGLGNVDGDPQLEVFINASSAYDGFVICYDGLTHAEQFRTAAASGESIHAMQIVDVDSDGQLEIVIATSREHTGAAGTYVYVFNGGTGALEWRSPASIGDYWAQLDHLKVANVDLDSNLEIIVAEEGGSLTVFDGITHVGQVVTGDLNITSIEAADVTGDGRKDIILADAGGNLTVRDPYTGVQTAFLGNFGGSAIKALVVKNAVGNSAPDYFFCQNDRLRIVYKDAANLTQTWESDPLPPLAGWAGSLLVDDIDGDGLTEIYLSDGQLGMRIYQINP